MAATKKGKKPSKPKSGSKPKKKSKKNNSGNVFTKMMLIILLLAVLATATFMILTNVKTKVKDKDNKTEIIVEKKNATNKSREQEPEIKETVIKEEASAEKKEVKKEEATPKEEVMTNVEKETPKTEQSEPAKKEQTEVIDLKKEFKENQTLSGCWLSNMQGASLTIDEYGYRIDFFGVDASKPMTGTYVIEGNLIIFKSSDDVCKNEEGSYRITFNKKDFSLNCKNDDCKKRRNILESDWEWIEIDN